MYESISSCDNAHLTRRALEVLRTPRAGLVTDIDGTISPIVARPEEARVLPEARGALLELQRHLELVGVVTGRSVQDARHMLDLDGLTYVGNHGLEVFADGQPELVPEARPWVPRMAQVLEQVSAQLEPELTQGVIVENKGASASLHYRLAPDPDRVRERLLAILRKENDLRIEEGRRVINLLPPLQISKGTAVTWIAREHALGAIVYLGDDITDTHAFDALKALRRTDKLQTLSIGVVGPETHARVKQLADAAVPSVSAVAELLQRILEGLETSDRMDLRAPRPGST